MKKADQPLERVLKAFESAMTDLMGDQSDQAAAWREVSAMTLRDQFIQTRKDGQCWFDAKDVLDCLELLADWRKDLPRFLHEHNRQKLLEAFLVMEVALVYAWAVRTRRAAARFAAAEVTKWGRVGGQSLGISERIHSLVLVARDEMPARTEEQALIARLVMRILAFKVERLQLR